jgi:shikimate dehydrogenase
VSVTSADTPHRAAVLGKPIAHSLSPVIHNAGFAAAGLTGWSYVAIECAVAELSALLDGLDASWAGLSLTMRSRRRRCASRRRRPRSRGRQGAANTLVRVPDGSWHADNTDVPGMVRVLRSVGLGSSPSVTVLGGGGTGRAALAAAAELGATEVTVVTRRAEARDELEPAADALGVKLIGAPGTRPRRSSPPTP